VMFGALLLQIVNTYAAKTAARGAAILTVDALNMVLIAVLVFLMLRQVLPIAATLAGGIALNSFGALSRAIDWGTGALRAAMRPGATYLYSKAGSGIETVKSRWRSFRD